MGYYLQIGADGMPQDLASNVGMGDLNKWIESLDVKAYGQVVHLSEWGWCQSLDDLESQLADAIESNGPQSPDVKHTADNLLTLVKDRDPDALTCYITDGIGPDDGADDDGDPHHEPEPEPDETETKAVVHDDAGKTVVAGAVGEDVSGAAIIASGDSAVSPKTAGAPEVVKARPARIANAHALTGLAGPLPQGEALAHVLRVQFHRIGLAVLAALDEWHAAQGIEGKAAGDRISWTGNINGLPANFTNLDPFAAELAENAQPLVSMLMQSGAAVLSARAGFDPDVLRVVNPLIPEAARNLTLKFCQETLDTTAKDVNAALDGLREELAQGLEAGDTRIELRNRVQAVFENADKNRAETIARTEASRATHKGERLAADKSGVVKTKFWIASADCCDVCGEYADKGEVALNEVYGGDSDWPVEEPPAHPRCQCAQGFGLKSGEEIEEAAGAE